MSKANVEYFLANYMGDFHSMAPYYLNAPYNEANPQQTGMITQVYQAFEANGVTLNISIN